MPSGDRDESPALLLNALLNAFVEVDIGSPGAHEKDFVSWGACLEDIEGAMELRHLRYFIAVAEEGSLTLAISNTRSAFR